MCSTVYIPDCADRTIFCSEPPFPERSVMNFTIKTNPNSNREYGTKIEYSCPERLHFFDYPVGDNFISYYYTKNINAINVTCNQDGWASISWVLENQKSSNFFLKSLRGYSHSIEIINWKTKSKFLWTISIFLNICIFFSYWLSSNKLKIRLNICFNHLVLFAL